MQSCEKSIDLQLNLLFKTILEEGTFPEDWKKSNVVPVHKKVQESDRKLLIYQSSSFI